MQETNFSGNNREVLECRNPDGSLASWTEPVAKDARQAALLENPMTDETNTPALNALFAQGQYNFQVTGFDVVLTLREDESQPVARTGFLLKVHPYPGSPAVFSKKLAFRVVGPAEKFDHSTTGDVFFGAIGVKEDGCEIFVTGTEPFLTQTLTALSLLSSVTPRYRCFVTLTTQTKVEPQTIGYVPILGVQLNVNEL